MSCTGAVVSDQDAGCRFEPAGTGCIEAAVWAIPACAGGGTRNTAGNSAARCRAKRLASLKRGGASIGRPSRGSGRPRTSRDGDGSGRGSRSGSEGRGGSSRRAGRGPRLSRARGPWFVVLPRREGGAGTGRTRSTATRLACGNAASLADIESTAKRRQVASRCMLSGTAAAGLRRTGAGRTESTVPVSR